MLRSMYAGISGMKGFQTKLDVIGNNIANVNTTGFKKGRVTFQDMMSQPMSGASAPTDIRGGLNPSQVGTGVQLGAIDNIHTGGNRQTTERPLDIQLEGDGMLVFARYPGGQEEIQYSRAGNLYLDDDGYVVNPNGQYLMGFSTNGAQPSSIDDIDHTTVGQIQIPESASSLSIQSNGLVTYLENGETRVAGQIALSKFSNAGGLEKVGANMYQTSQNAGQFETGENNSIYFQPESDGTAALVSGALEMSNVDLSEEFTEMITAQRGFQANTRIITTSDEILQELVNLKR
ncbi:flagellar basal body rod protein FlgG [Gracilibacillus alcaliphilus]|uniref:flagellar basal body rod protein FlgG n=1 Tax=Gracilibacillus alcaliphilus TaxID=1401441 RepID=UPI00195D18EE|nr:flagellar basal body rod protein FlgG [Gracilibacillus alcaliphilus]MBM7677940.1 flagellar hook protein FlgE [Gracilibacillus alcaliphilus]